MVAIINVPNDSVSKRNFENELENVLKNASEISKQKYQEIVLTGVNIGDYGKGEFGNKNTNILS
jgi:tRNA A37 methylthiotransferase MiaB